MSTPVPRHRRVAIAIVSAVLFALGLAVGGMLDTRNVIGFLDVGGDFRPALAFVMGGAIAVFAPLYALHLRREPGTVRVDLPVRDPKLFAGAVLFGVGWGLVGYCPGPAIVALGAAAVGVNPLPTLVFVVSMFAGMLLHRGFASVSSRTIERRCAVEAWVTDPADGLATGEDG